MDNIPSAVLAEFIKACHGIAARKLLRCSSGNLSLRLDEDYMIITASKSWMAEMTVERITMCRIDDGSVVHGKPPSIEIQFHHELMKRRPDVNAVLHYQSPAATAITCMPAGSVDFNAVPEIPFNMGRVGAVPYLLPGSPELAAEVIRVMLDHDIATMQNHGQITVGPDLRQVVQNAEFFELACDIILRSGGRAVPLSSPDVEELITLGLTGHGRSGV